MVNKEGTVNTTQNPEELIRTVGLEQYAVGQYELRVNPPPPPPEGDEQAKRQARLVEHVKRSRLGRMFPGVEWDHLNKVEFPDLGTDFVYVRDPRSGIVFHVQLVGGRLVTLHVPSRPIGERWVSVRSAADVGRILVEESRR